MTSEDRTIEYLKEVFPDGIEKLDEASNIYLSEIDLEIFKSEFPDKLNFLSKKLAYPYEKFRSLDD